MNDFNKIQLNFIITLFLLVSFGKNIDYETFFKMHSFLNNTANS